MWRDRIIFPLLATAKAMKSITSQRVNCNVCVRAFHLSRRLFMFKVHKWTSLILFHTIWCVRGVCLFLLFCVCACDLLCGERFLLQFNYRLCIWHIPLNCNAFNHSITKSVCIGDAKISYYFERPRTILHVNRTTKHSHASITLSLFLYPRIQRTQILFSHLRAFAYTNWHLTVHFVN